jgi:hypothetical protein
VQAAQQGREVPGGGQRRDRVERGRERLEAGGLGRRLVRAGAVKRADPARGIGLGIGRGGLQDVAQDLPQRDWSAGMGLDFSQPPQAYW